MKRYNSLSLFWRLYPAWIFLLAALFMIHSCKKDNKTQSLANPAVDLAKQWYEATYSTPMVRTTVQANRNRGIAGRSVFDYAKHIKPDWLHGATYTRFNAAVVELPVDPSSSQIGTTLGYSPNGNNLYKARYSRSSFLILNDSTGYHAYIMTIIADSTYLKGDLSKLDRNKYNKRDADFSGAVLYATPDGKYVNGWIYKNGNIVWAIPPSHVQNSPSAVNANKTITPKVAKTGRFKINTRLLEVTTCYTWTQTTTVPSCGSCEPVVIDLGTTCTTQYIPSGGGDSGTTGGSVGTSGGSGGGSGPSTPQPCSVPPASAVVSPNNHLFTRMPQTPPGFPPPTSTTNPCPEVTVTTTQIDTIAKVMQQPTSLTAAQMAQLQAVLNQLLQNCLGQAIYNYFTTNGDQFDFEVAPGISEQASYNPASGVINMKNPSTLTSAALQEEFFHAYQNFTYPGGTAQYLGQAGSANIEFEAKVVKDIMLNFNLINGTSSGGQLAVNDPNYNSWLNNITDNFTKYPTSFTSTQLNQYFSFMSEFIQQNPGYANDIIMPTLNPSAMFSLINSSPCSK